MRVKKEMLFVIIFIVLLFVSVYALEEFVGDTEDTYQDVYEVHTHVFVPKFNVSVFEISDFAYHFPTQTFTFNFSLNISALDSPNFTIANAITDYNHSINITHDGTGVLWPANFSEGYIEGRTNVTIFYNTTEVDETIQIYINDTQDSEHFIGKNETGGDDVTVEFDTTLPCEECIDNCYIEQYYTCCDGDLIPKYMKVTISGIQDCDGYECEDINGEYILECSNLVYLFGGWLYEDLVSDIFVSLQMTTMYGGAYSAKAGKGAYPHPYHYPVLCFRALIPVDDRCACSASLDNDVESGDCDCSTPYYLDDCGYDGTFSWEPCNEDGSPCESCDMSLPE